MHEETGVVRCLQMLMRRPEVNAKHETANSRILRHCLSSSPGLAGRGLFIKSARRCTREHRVHRQTTASEWGPGFAVATSPLSRVPLAFFNGRRNAYWKRAFVYIRELSQIFVALITRNLEHCPKRANYPVLLSRFRLVHTNEPNLVRQNSATAQQKQQCYGVAVH